MDTTGGDLYIGIKVSSDGINIYFEIFAIMYTTDLRQGDKVRLLEFGQTDSGYRRRLLSFGVTRGVEIEVVRVAPLGCPLQVQVRGTQVSLRKEEASCLLWERV